MTATQEKKIKPSLYFRRLSHLVFGHDYDESVKLERVEFNNHPQNLPDHIYVANLMHCKRCGLEWLDTGFSSRDFKG